jgi:hypothetical protein
VPRWAEMVVIAVIGVVLIGALMVYAKYKTQRDTPPPTSVVAGSSVKPAPEPSSAVVATTRKPTTRKPTTVEDVELAAAMAVQTTVVTKPTAAVDPAPAAPTAAALAGLPAAVRVVAADSGTSGDGDTSGGSDAPGDNATVGIAAPAEVGGNDTAAGVAAPTVPEGAQQEGESEGGKTAEEKAGAKPKFPAGPVKAGTREELLLLAHAERSLKRIQALRLRTDIPPQARINEERRLRAILSRLPEKSRAEMESWISGVDQPAPKNGGLEDAGVGAQNPDEREAGKVDDNNRAVKETSRKVRSLSKRLDTPPPRPSRPTVNPRALPAARPPTAGTPLPAASSSGLD